EIELLNPLLTSFCLCLILVVPAVSFRLYLRWRPPPAPDSPARMVQFQSAELSANLSARSIASLARSECAQSRHFYPPSRNCSVLPLRRSGTHSVQCAHCLRAAVPESAEFASPAHHEGSPFQSQPKDSASAGVSCRKRPASERSPKLRSRSALPRSPP